MIKYALKCSAGHCFESWFQSAGSFDRLRDAGHLSCPACGDREVEKALMAPKLAPAKKGAHMKGPPAAATGKDVDAALARMKAEVEAHSDYVGESFASEARAIHLDEAPARAIHGEAKPEEARALVEDGVPILPLPFRPTRKTN